MHQQALLNKAHRLQQEAFRLYEVAQMYDSHYPIHAVKLAVADEKAQEAHRYYRYAQGFALSY